MAYYSRFGEQKNTNDAFDGFNSRTAISNAEVQQPVFGSLMSYLGEQKAESAVTTPVGDNKGLGNAATRQGASANRSNIISKQGDSSQTSLEMGDNAAAVKSTPTPQEQPVSVSPNRPNITRSFGEGAVAKPQGTTHISGDEQLYGANTPIDPSMYSAVRQRWTGTTPRGGTFSGTATIGAMPSWKGEAPGVTSAMSVVAKNVNNIGTQLSEEQKQKNRDYVSMRARGGGAYINGDSNKLLYGNDRVTAFATEERAKRLALVKQTIMDQISSYYSDENLKENISETDSDDITKIINDLTNGAR